MDDLDDFLNDFSSGSRFQRQALSAGAVGGRMIPNPEFERQIEKRDVEGIEYAETYKKEEEKRLYKVKT
jgi:hypothetical protein